MGLKNWVNKMINRGEKGDINTNNIYPETEDQINSKNDLTEPTIKEDLFVASESELSNLNNMANKTTLLEIIEKKCNDYCNQNMESKGFRDSMNNSDIANRDLNKQLIIAGYKNILTESLEALKNKTNKIEERIKLYESEGMLESLSRFQNEKNNHQTKILFLSEILSNEEKIISKLEFCLVSYNIGFIQGIKSSDDEILSE